MWIIPWVGGLLTLLSPMFVMGWLPGFRNKRMAKANEKKRREKRRRKLAKLGIKVKDQDKKAASEIIPLNPMNKDDVPLDLSTTQWHTWELMWMDPDPVYKFNFNTIFSYLFLFNLDYRVIIVTRRYLFIVALLVVLFFGIAELQIFYHSVANRSILKIFHWGYDLILKVHLHSKSDFRIGMTLYCLALPAAAAAIIFFCLFPLFGQKRNLGEILTWDQKETRLGRYMMADKHAEEKVYNSYEAKLIDMMSIRLGYLASGKLYKYFAEDWICKLPSYLVMTGDENSTGRFLKKTGKVIWYIVRFPVFVFCIPVHCFPAFTMWMAIFIAPKRVLKAGCGGMLSIPLLYCGLAMLMIIAFYLCTVYGQVRVYQSNKPLYIFLITIL